MDIERMPERGSHHRRSHSDTSFRLAADFDDLLLFDPSDFDISTFPLPSPSAAGGTSGACAAVPITIDSDESSGHSSRPRPAGAPVGGHHRSLSVDSDFFNGLGIAGDSAGDDKIGENGGGKRRAGHHRSTSMDGSATTSFESDSYMDYVKKAMAPEKLAELALNDPKRAKRILANRQSAARSKERKVRYTNELEKRVQTLQTEATNLSAQLTMLQKQKQKQKHQDITWVVHQIVATSTHGQKEKRASLSRNQNYKRDTTDLAAHNKELKLKLEALEQEAKLREDLNAALKEELQRLRGQNIHLSAIASNPSFGGMFNQLASQLSMQQLNNPSPQQPQLGIPPPPSDQPFNGQRRPNFMDFNHQN